MQRSSWRPLHELQGQPPDVKPPIPRGSLRRIASDSVTIEDQQVQYFGTPTSCMARTSLQRIIRRIGPAHAEWIAAWYLQMRDLAKNGTSFGEFTTDIAIFVGGYGGYAPAETDLAYPGWKQLCVSLWEAFVAEGVVEIHGDPSDLTRRFRVTVIDFDQTNTRRMSARPRRTRTDDERRAKDAERKRLKRLSESGQGAGIVRATSESVRGLSASALNRQTDDRDKQDILPVGPADADAVLIPTLHIGDYEPGDTRAMTAEIRQSDTNEANVWVISVASQLATILEEGDAVAVKVAGEILLPKTRRVVRAAGKILPLDQWERAVTKVVAKVQRPGGAAPQDIDELVGWIINAVPTAHVDATVRRFVAAADQAPLSKEDRMRQLLAENGAAS